MQFIFLNTQRHAGTSAIWILHQRKWAMTQVEWAASDENRTALEKYHTASFILSDENFLTRKLHCFRLNTALHRFFCRMKIFSDKKVDRSSRVSKPQQYWEVNSVTIKNELPYHFSFMERTTKPYIMSCIISQHFLSHNHFLFFNTYNQPHSLAEPTILCFQQLQT